MSAQTTEARIILTIEAIRSSKKMSRRHTAKIYGVPESFFRDRINGKTPKAERRDSQYKLTLSEEQTFVQYVFDLDARGFPPRIAGVCDIADLLLATRRTKLTGKQWAYRFVQHCPELKTRLSRAYDK